MSQTWPLIQKELGNIHTWEVGDTLQYLMAPHYPYAIKIPIPQIWYLNLLQCHLWLPTPSQRQLHISLPNQRTQWCFGLTSSQWACAGPSGRVLTTQILRGSLAALRKIAPKEIPCSALVLSRMANQSGECLNPLGPSGCSFVGFLTHPSASSAGNVVIPLPFWSLTMVLGSLLSTGEYSALLRQSQAWFFALCYE